MGNRPPTVLPPGPADPPEPDPGEAAAVLTL